jgi:putative intracellular protease/amidase
MERRVLIPLPDRDFDVSEVAVPWRLLTDAGYTVVFATERGATPACDPRLLVGVIFGLLGAAPEPKRFYRELEQARGFQAPITWRDIEPESYDGLLLPGGHAPGMRQYLGSEILREKIFAYWQLGRPVAAICHGVLVLARTRDPKTGRSLLWNRRTTCLPKYMERGAYLATFWKLGRYYRTYDAYVEDEVKSALSEPTNQFERGPRVLGNRGIAGEEAHAFVVEDGQYLSARWPGDAYVFARRFLSLLGATASHAA